MRFGVYIGPVFPGDWTPQQMSEHVRQQAQVAFNSNFEGLFAAHHYLIGPAVAMFQPLTLLSHLLGQFPGMHVGTSIFLLPFHHPVDVAEQTASLDVLSGGKLLFGVGQGYRDIEFQSFGIDKSSRRRRVTEAIKAIRKLWAEDNVSFHGEFFRFEGVSINPKPIQRPAPPILMAGDTVLSVSKVSEVGDYWIASRRHSKVFLRKALPAYKASLEKYGRPFKGLPIFRDLCVADNAEKAEQRIKHATEQMYQLYKRWGQPGERYDLSFDELKQERLVVGNPKEVAEQVMAYHEEFGAEYMWFNVYWPGMDPQYALETIQVFGEQVIPQIKRATPVCPVP